MFKMALVKAIGWRFGNILMDVIVGVIMLIKEKLHKTSTEEQKSRIFRRPNLTIAVTCMNCS